MAERHFQLPASPNLDYHRKVSRALAAGDEQAVSRAVEAIGPRRRRFVLADAQRVIASEHGFATWAAFRRAAESRCEPDRPVARIGSGDGRDSTEPLAFYEQRAAGGHAARDRDLPRRIGRRRRARRSRIVPSAFWVCAAVGRADLLDAWFAADGSLLVGADEPRPNIADVGWPPEPPPTEDPTEILGEALCHAAHNGRLETVELLLRRGALVDAIHFGLTASFRDLARHRSVVEKLVEHGADLAIRDGQHDGNPLDWARHMLEERRDDARAVETLRFLEQRCGA